MAEVFFDNPPILNGDEKTQLVQMQRYLTAMSEKLNEALMSISIEQFTPQAQAQIRKAAGEESGANSAEALKSMIIKTANIVRHEMDEITTVLQDNYTALSEQFGEYERNLTSNIRATAEGVLQDYHYEERVQGLEDEAGNTEVFIRRINQYIYSGLIDEIGGKYGIAIGENVTSYDEQGNPYLNPNRKMATFTMDRLSFWQGDTEVAYFSNNTFYIPRGEILHTLRMGDMFWQILPDGSMALIGE